MVKKAATKRKRKTSPHRSGAEEDHEAGGAHRALWSGSISFGLLQIPVALHVAEQTRELSFHQLDRRDLAPIHYQRVNASTGKQVEWKDVVRGYEHAPGRFVVVEDADLAAANVEATRTIDLQDFVDEAEILPVFFERPYYVVPGKRADKAYALFRDALRRKKVVAVGTVVIRTRQHLCALFPQKDVLVLELLRFSHDLRSTAGLAIPKAATPSGRELSMAEALIDSMRTDWDPSRYQDHYHDELLALIERKAKTGKVEAASKARAPKSNVVDLMTLLRKSLKAREKSAEAREKKPKPGRARRRETEKAA